MVLSVAVSYADVLDEPPADARKLLFVPAGEAAAGEGSSSPDAVPADVDVQRKVTLYERRDGFVHNDKNYIRIKQKYIPEVVYNTVEDNPGNVAPTISRR